MALHDQDLPGDILIFLTGQQECESAVSMLEEEARRYRRAQGGSLRLMPVALYAGLPAADQLQAFQSTPRGYRKVGVLDQLIILGIHVGHKLFCTSSSLVFEGTLVQ